MNRAFKSYEDAKEYARELAALGGPDAGIRKTMEFGAMVYAVGFLPKKENCYGSELTAERVSKGD